MEIPPFEENKEQVEVSITTPINPIGELLFPNHSQDIQKFFPKSTKRPISKRNPNGNNAGRPLFDGKDEAQVLSRLCEIWALGGSYSEACYYANISQDSYYRYLKAHPEVDDYRKKLLDRPVLLARLEVLKGLKGNPEFSLRYLERKKKDEFAPKVEAELSTVEPVNEEVFNKLKSLSPSEQQEIINAFRKLNG